MLHPPGVGSAIRSVTLKTLARLMKPYRTFKLKLEESASCCLLPHDAAQIALMHRLWMGSYTGECSQKVLMHMLSGLGISNMTMQGVASVSVMSSWGSAGRECAWK